MIITSGTFERGDCRTIGNIDKFRADVKAKCLQKVEGIATRLFLSSFLAELYGLILIVVHFYTEEMLKL